MVFCGYVLENCLFVCDLDLFCVLVILCFAVVADDAFQVGFLIYYLGLVVGCFADLVVLVDVWFWLCCLVRCGVWLVFMD